MNSMALQGEPGQAVPLGAQGGRLTAFTSLGTYIARPFPAYSTGDFPLQHATFSAPGAPRRVWGGIRIQF